MNPIFLKWLRYILVGVVAVGLRVQEDISKNGKTF
jgi:hypothetical protein